MSKEETMVERCAEAVKAKLFELRHRRDTMGFEEIAVAVIDALMEPTPAMLEAATDVSEVDGVDWVGALLGTGIGSYQQIFEASYRAMLSKAKEGTGE